MSPPTGQSLCFAGFKMNRLTVVIPTYNRAAVLKRALEAYRTLSNASLVEELIVVDDGSTDETGAVVRAAAEISPFPVKYFRQENKGPAAARNVGIREAKCEVILFTDDDIAPSAELVLQHASWHSDFPEQGVAVLGHVTWAPEVNATPFMRWYGSDGALFAYGHICKRTEVDHSYFYTCNLSLKTQFLRKQGAFDEDFKVAAYEDLELGCRLRQAGLRLLYNRNAVAYHHQYVSFDEACRKAKRASVAWEVFRRKEAGRDANLSAEARPMHRIRRRLASFKRRIRKQLAVPLGPLRALMDSRLPLPGIVYRAMFEVYR